MSRHTQLRLLCALGLALGMHGLGWLITQPMAEHWLLAHRWWRLDDLWMALHLGPLLAAGGLDHWNERLFVGAAWLQWLLIGYGLGIVLVRPARSVAASTRSRVHDAC
jgi:hypothetical protein